MIACLTNQYAVLHSAASLQGATVCCAKTSFLAKVMHVGSCGSWCWLGLHSGASPPACSHKGMIFAAGRGHCQAAGHCWRCWGQCRAACQSCSGSRWGQYSSRWPPEWRIAQHCATTSRHRCHLCALLSLVRIAVTDLRCYRATVTCDALASAVCGKAIR